MASRLTQLDKYIQKKPTPISIRNRKFVSGKNRSLKLFWGFASVDEGCYEVGANCVLSMSVVTPVAAVPENQPRAQNRLF